MDCRAGFDILLFPVFDHIGFDAGFVGGMFPESFLHPGKRSPGFYCMDLFYGCMFFAVIAPAEEDVIAFGSLNPGPGQFKVLLSPGGHFDKEGSGCFLFFRYRFRIFFDVTVCVSGIF